MMIRCMVGIFAALILLAGASQIVFAYWWLDRIEAMTAPALLRLWGILAVAIGILLVVASIKKQVGLRLFVLILGLYVLVSGVVTFAGPSLMRDLVEALVLKRTLQFQVTMLWTAGLLRIGLGGALLYAAIRLPRAQTQAE